MARLPYRVLKPISYYGERAERGVVVLLEPSEAENIGTDYVEAENITPAQSAVQEPEAPAPAPAPSDAPAQEPEPSNTDENAGQ